jgi:predicted membrane-bound spermidine synthase
MLFDGGGAQCSASIAFFSFALSDNANSIMCRAVFGFGGLLTLGFALLMTWAAIRKRGQPAREAAKP